MPDAYRVVDRIQDQSDFDSGWTAADSDGFPLVWDVGSGLWTPTSIVISANTISATAPASGAGNPLTLSGSAAVSGNTNGGDAIVQLALKSGSGVDGKMRVVTPSAVDVFTVANSNPNATLQISDSTYSGLVIKSAVSQGSSTRSLDVQNSASTSMWSVSGSDGSMRMRDRTVADTVTIFMDSFQWYVYTSSGYGFSVGRQSGTGYHVIGVNKQTPAATLDVCASGTTNVVRVTTSDGTTSILTVGASGGVTVYCPATTTVGQKIQLASGTPTADALQVTLSDGTTVLTNVTADGYVYSRKSDATQYAGLRGSGSSPAYPGLHAYHDSGHGYLTLGYGTWEAYIGTTSYWSLTSSLMANNTVETRLGLDSNVTVHEIRRRNSIANAAKGGGLKIHADNGPTGATNSDGGDIWVYGGTLRGTGVDGDVHLGYDGTTRTGKTKIYVPAYPAVSPTALSANVNDYAPTAGRFQRWSTDGGNYTVTGLSLSQVDGQEITIINLGSGTITLSDEDVASTAANRFLCVSGASITLDPDERADLLYDATSARWRVF